MNSRNERQNVDRAWPETVQWSMGIGVPVNETVWRCEAMRGGQLYQTVMFDTLAEAQEFTQKMRDVEPDQFFNVEMIKASTVWN